MDKRKIRVFAMGGATTWSKPEERHLPLKLMDYVHHYNERNSDNRLVGIEYDIESYNQDGFPDTSFTKKEIVLSELLDTVDTIAVKQENYNREHPNQQTEIGFSVPYWFDNENKNIKSITWLGKTGPVIYHMMDRLNRLPKSNLVVMAYRNAARGNDGSIAHIRTEIEYAQYKASNVKIILGQETTDVEPSKITFYGKSVTEMAREMDLVKLEFTKSNVLGGVAVNDMQGLLEMNDN